MATPLIYRKNDEVQNSGTYSKSIIEGSDVKGPDGKGIEIGFRPRSSISIRSAPFLFAKNKIVNEWGLGALWDNTGAMNVYFETEQEGSIGQVIKLMAWCYAKVLDYDGHLSDEFVEIAPGMWMLESDIALAHLSDEGKAKLDTALREIFTQRPRMFLIATPEKEGES